MPLIRRTRRIFTVLSILFLLAPIGFIVASVSTTNSDRQVVVLARQFEFTPSVIRAKIGDTITFVLQSNDSRHGFFIQELNVDLEVNVQAPVQTTVLLDKAGTFLFVCNIPCGNYHPYMNGKLEVSPNISLLIVVSAISLLTAYSMWKLRDELDSEEEFTPLSTVKEEKR